jgi:hypothetical protein
MVQRNYWNAQAILKVGYMSTVYHFIVADRGEPTLSVHRLCSDGSSTLVLEFTLHLAGCSSLYAGHSPRF